MPLYLLVQEEQQPQLIQDSLLPTVHFGFWCFQDQLAFALQAKRSFLFLVEKLQQTDFPDFAEVC